MRTEIINVPNRGVCILISDINPNDFLKAGGLPVMNNLLFKDIQEIARHMREGQKIAAIKEIRSQTGWGLKQSKEFTDKYMIGGYECDGSAAADKFIQDQTPIVDFIDAKEMEI